MPPKAKRASAVKATTVVVEDSPADEVRAFLEAEDQPNEFKYGGVMYSITHMGRPLPFKVYEMRATGPRADELYTACRKEDLKEEKDEKTTLYKFVKDMDGKMHLMSPAALEKYKEDQPIYTPPMTAALISGGSVTIRNATRPPAPREAFHGPATSRRVTIGFEPGPLRTAIDRPETDTPASEKQTQFTRMMHLFGNLLFHACKVQHAYDPMGSWGCVDSETHFMQMSPERLQGRLEMFTLLFTGGNRKMLDALRAIDFTTDMMQDPLMLEYLPHLLTGAPVSNSAPFVVTPPATASTAAAASAPSAASASSSAAATAAPMSH